MAYCICAEVRLSSRLQIPAPRMKCERNLPSGITRSLSVCDRGRAFPGRARLQWVCVDILHKKQGEKVWKTEKFWLDFPGLFMI